MVIPAGPEKQLPPELRFKYGSNYDSVLPMRGKLRPWQAMDRSNIVDEFRVVNCPIRRRVALISDTKCGKTKMTLDGTRTLGNLKAAFAGESQANGRYLYFAEQADTERNEAVAITFRSISNGETKHAFGHIGWLNTDPVTGHPIGGSEKNLKAAFGGEVYEFTEMYPGFARVACDEGHIEIAEWNRLGFRTARRKSREPQPGH
jgi:rubrerythrin